MKKRAMGFVGAMMIAASIGAFAAHEAHAGQPDMREALEKLRGARQALNDSPGGKGGHRVEALKLVDQAIDQVKAGIEYDKTH